MMDMKLFGTRMVYFKVPSQNMPGGSEEKHKNPQNSRELKQTNYLIMTFGTYKIKHISTINKLSSRPS